MDQLKKTLIQRTRLRLAETWLSRIQVLSIWLDQISAQEIIDDDANELIIDHSSVESSAVDEGRSKRLCTTNLSTDGDTFHKSSGTHVSLSALRIGQARVKRECFRILSACDETRVLVNLRFLDVPSHTIKTLEGKEININRKMTRFQHVLNKNKECVNNNTQPSIKATQILIPLPSTSIYFVC